MGAPCTIEVHELGVHEKTCNGNEYVMEYDGLHSYSCDTCGKEFSELSSLNIHRETHLFKRDLCKKTFSPSDNYKIHMKTHANDHPFRCNICSKRFDQYEAYKRHIELHMKKKNLRCGLCEKLFNTIIQYKEHLRTHSFKTYDCEFCSATFLQMGKKVEHIKRQHPDRHSFNMSEIRKKNDKAQQKKSDIRKHINKNYEAANDECIQINSRKCDECGKIFDKMRDYKRHCMTHLEDSNLKKKLNGNLTNKDLSNSEDLIYICELCEKVFDSSVNYVQHMATHDAKKAQTPEENTYINKTIKIELADDLFHEDGSNIDHENLEKENEEEEDSKYQLHKKLFNDTSDDSNSMQNDTTEFEVVECDENVKKCEICEEVFDDPSEWKEHLQTHVVKQDDDCSINEITDSSELLYEESVISEHELKPGSFELILIDGGETYVITQMGDETEDGEVIEFEDPIESHLEIKHDSGTEEELQSTAIVTCVCEVCGKNFGNMRNLKMHMTVHTSVPQYQCENCGREFRRNVDYKRHMKVHTGERPFACEVCGKSFLRYASKVRHTRTHMNNDDQNVEIVFKDDNLNRCDLCGESFRDINDLKVHIKQHTGEPITCDQCDTICDDVLNYKTHMETHAPKHACDQCHEQFNTRGGYKKHMQMHTTENPSNIICTICGKFFRSTHNLKIHMRIHTSCKPYSCNICGKTFTQTSSHAIHMRVHTGERPYKCTVCGKTFSQTGHQRTHMRIHTGQRPFKCELCTKTFSDYGNYIKHKRLHTGDQPFKCVLCNKGFSRRKRYEIHMMTHER